MGINRQALKTILFENNFKPLSGKVLLIGKSTVNIAKEILDKLLLEYLGYVPEFKEIDNITKAAKENGYFINDRELFRKISDQIEEVHVMDVSDYESAEIVADLNCPISSNLYEKYDLIYDSSVLDNVFNPSNFILNVSSMLKPGGRYIGCNGTNFFPGTMVAVHPEWFYAFFAVNKYKDARVYLANCVKEGLNRFEYDTDLWLYRPFFTRDPKYNYYEAAKSIFGIYLTFVVAEKGNFPANFNDFKYPINLQYIQSSNAVDWSSTHYHDFDKKRPIMMGKFIENQKVPVLPMISDHFIYLGSDF